MNQEKSWPKLREDLTLHVGPADINGAPTWTIHDPARNQYFSIDWMSFEIILRLYLADIEEICRQVNELTTLEIDEDSVKSVLSFISENELTQRLGVGDIGWLRTKANTKELNWSNKLLHGYLFFRIPLFQPEAFLKKAIHHLDFFYSKTFFNLTIFALCLGLWGVFRQWSLFQTTVVDTFSLDGLIGYSSALIVIKIFHEFGHALTATKYQCRVPTMGVAFLVMWPVAYTDVTESWKLSSHRERLAIAGAGIMTELFFASWALLGWTMSPEGALKGVFFFIATTSLAATLAINASPFMRFDGYFLLCDFLKIPNLHQRSFAYARWWLREKLFGLGDAPPEDFIDKRKWFILAFAFATWLYRFIVFIGIAVLVYKFFFKLLGIGLFVIEIWFFLAKPIFNEILVWKKRWGEIAPTIVNKPAFYIGLILFLMLVLPLNMSIHVQGIYKPRSSISLTAFQPGQLVFLPKGLGSRVNEGDLILKMNAPEIDFRIIKTKNNIATLEKQFGAIGFDRDAVSKRPVLEKELDSSKKELAGLFAEKERLNVKANFDGVVVEIDPDLSLGEWVPKDMHLATVIDDQHWVVDCYVEEGDLNRIELGSSGTFVPEAPRLDALRLRVVSIDRDASRSLSDGSLASISGGQILVRQQSYKVIPEHAIYRVRLDVLGRSAKLSTGYLRGEVKISAWPKSILGGTIRTAINNLIREMGF